MGCRNEKRRWYKIENILTITFYNSDVIILTLCAVYMFPCFNCGDPAGQLINATNYLASNNATFTRLWLDVENSALWSTNISKNNEFFQTLLDTGQMLGKYKIYTVIFQFI